MMSEDERLVQRCLSGEKETFGLLVDKYKHAVYGLAYRMTHNFHDAQDIGQEVFIDAYKNLRSLKYPHRFRSWIYTITVNRCRMWLRKRRPEALAIASLEKSESKAVLRNQALQQNRDRKRLDRLLDAIDELPEANRLVTTLYYINGLTCKEIGEFTGTSINTVMSKLRRGREALRKQFTEMPAQATTQQKVHSGFTAEVLGVIENLSPTFQPPSNPLGRIAWLPWTAALIIGLFVMGTKPVVPLKRLYDGREMDRLARISPLWSDGITVSMISEVHAAKPVLTPPSVAENTLYAAVEPVASDESTSPGGILQYRLFPGDILTYRIKMENIAVTRRGNRVSHRAEGLHTLLVKEVEPNGVMHIVNMAQDKLMIPGEQESPYVTLGVMFIRGNGQDESRGECWDWDRDGFLKLTFRNEMGEVVQGSLLSTLSGISPLEPLESIYFVPFSDLPLKGGSTWREKQSKYTAIGFEKVSGYNCVILDWEQEVSRDHEGGFLSVKKMNARIACDTQSGVVVKLDAEIQTEIQMRNDEKESVTVELIRKDQLTREELAVEKQALFQIESALAEQDRIDRFEPDANALRQKLEAVRTQYPSIHLMPGLVDMIEEVDQQIARESQAVHTVQTYRDRMHSIATLLLRNWEEDGRYRRYVLGAGTDIQRVNRDKYVIIDPRTPNYEYEVIDIEESGENAKCKIIARGKKGTPTEGEAWVKTLSASEGASEIQPYVESNEEGGK